jgi:hypothetical protein
MIRKLSVVTFISIVLAFFSDHAKGQDILVDSLKIDPLDSLIFQSFDIYENIEDQLLPLDTIIDIANEEHPQIKFQEALIRANEYNIKNTRSLWMNTLYAFGNYTTGNQQLTLADVGGTSVDSRITNGYVLGLGLRVPLYEFLGRRNFVNQVKAERDASVEMREVMKVNLNRSVIDEYYELITRQRTMIIAAQNAYTQDVNVELAEQGLLTGQVPMEDYARFVSIRAAAKMLYEEEKRDFYRQFSKFEELVGVKMIELKVGK